MVDPARVRRLLERLAEYRTLLGELASLPLDRYLADAYAGRYLVQASAQVCIDLANHVISSESWRVPEDFRDAFTVLEENGVIPPDLAERLRALAGLRNRLVHLYGDVEDAMLHEFLPGGLDDLDAFGRAVAGLLDDRPG